MKFSLALLEGKTVERVLNGMVHDQIRAPSKAQIDMPNPSGKALLYESSRYLTA